MREVGIVTDSSASIPQELINSLELAIVPMGIQIDGTVLREGIDISTDKFYNLIDEAQNMTTSQPAPGDFITVYQQATNKAKELISIHVTSKASGTVQVANLVKDNLNFKVSVFDSASCSMGQGFMAIEAAIASLQGKSKAEILELLEGLREKMAIYVAVPTLKYLTKSGKVNKVKALLANMLNIKPILGMRSGVAEVLDKVRSYPKALERLITLTEERFPEQPLNIAILHTNAPEMAEKFREKVEKRLKCAKVFTAEMGSALAVHGGKGMLGIAAYPAKQITKTTNEEVLPNE